MALREIALDTETTGLDPRAGHRLVELACLELVDHVPSGRSLHKYINPERDMPSEAEAIHGLSTGFLADQPVFADIADEFLDFIAADRLIIHNAEFDIRFLNAELTRLDRPVLSIARAIDTVQLARRKFPGAQVNLDALCRRFGIDLSGREKHGALIDTELLARVYLELIGGRQAKLALDADTRARAAPRASTAPVVRTPRAHAPSAAEEANHAALLDRLEAPIWRRK